MEKQIKVEVTIKYDADKPHLCDHQCEFCRLDTMVHPDEAFCNLYNKDLLTQLDFDDFSKLRIQRCDQCKIDSQKGE
jgi:hypothetical protein